MRVDDDSYIQLYELHNDIDVMRCINIQWQSCFGQVVRMEEDAPARRVFDAGICRILRRGRPCILWKDQIEEDLSSIGVTNLRRRVRAEAPERMCYYRPKSINRAVMAI